MIATPDHWHARQTIDACKAEKDVYCEKPMTHTIDEAVRAEAVDRHKRIMTVGVQSTADPRWKMANQMIAEGKIGKVMQGQTSYYRNSQMGQWRYYELTEDMNPKTVDWKMFLGTDFGLAPEQPFNRAKYAQWRCYRLRRRHVHGPFVHQLTHLIQAMGVTFPPGRRRRRPLPRIRRPRLPGRRHRGRRLRRGLPGPHLGHHVQRRAARRGHPRPHRHDPLRRDPEQGLPRRRAEDQRQAGPGGNTGEGGELFKPDQPTGGDADTRALWDHFISCIRQRNQENLCPARLGYAAIATVNLGVKSYREGKAFFLDSGTGEVCPADSSWAARWEERSKLRGKPNQTQGWKVDQPLVRRITLPDYQKLEGDWVGGQDPAKA
ncbi:MAG: Gfo/Idh/MocA family oxidoreductase [Isosphaeraceae bacterium]